MNRKNRPMQCYQKMFFFIPVAAFFFTPFVGAEEITLTTFYPSPSGIYEQVETTGKTILATDGDSFVGIGTSSPVAELDIRHEDAQTAVMLSGSDQQQVAINMFTKGQPTQKNLVGVSGVKAWHIVAKGDDRKSQNQAPNDQRNHLELYFYDGDIEDPTQRFYETLALGPGKVGIKRVHPEYELDLNGTLGIGNSAVDFGTAEIFAQTPASGFASQTTFQAGSVPASDEVRHVFYFKTRDESTVATTQKTIADVAVDGKVIAGEDVLLTRTNHLMSQTGFVTGTYQGNGANQKISLNFPPRYIKIWSQALGGGFINAATFEKTFDMSATNGLTDSSAVFGFSEHLHVSVAGGSPTKNEDTIGRTFTYIMSNLIEFELDEEDGYGFRVFGSDNTVPDGYFETSGLDTAGNPIQYFFTAYR